MQLDLDRTIVAVSSPLSAAARAIVRLSGKMTIDVLQRVLGDSGTKLREISNATCFQAAIDLAWFDRTIDATVYFWPNQQSFTGEPCAELHFLGSMPLVHKVVQRLTSAGAQPAERGEFALRGFLAGKLDLVQAEAILGVIESTVPDQLEWALGQLGGNISRPVRQLRSELMELLAHLEAGLDFVEEDIEFISTSELHARLSQIAQRIDALDKQLDSRGVSDRKFEIALVGRPNAGKSSLFNRLLGSSRTIVSEQAGTTRDVVTSALELDGVSISMIDTAGIEELYDASPRAMAQEVLKQRVKTCDAVLLCVDLSDKMDEALLSEQIDDVRHKLQLSSQQLLTVGTKADLTNRSSSLKVDLVVSIHRADSIDLLKTRLQQLVESQTNQQFTQATHHTAVRCRDALCRASQGLQLAIEILVSESGEELVAGQLHGVLEDLASIIGEVHNDDILGEIFSRFCIGK